METGLKDPNVYPDDKTVKSVLGNAYPAYAGFIKTVTHPPYSMTAEWRYYNDGKSWLCKIQSGKKTMAWMSVSEGFFRVSVYVSRKHFAEVDALSIDESIKETFSSSRTGTFSPVTFCVRSRNQIPDVLTLVAFRQTIA